MWKLIPASQASALVTNGMVIVALTMAMLIVVAAYFAARRYMLVTAVVIACVLAGEVALANSSLLQRWDLRPPPFMLMFLPLTVMTIRLGLTGFGTALASRLPLALIIGSQAFRLPLELIMHQASLEGVMPPQLSYSGFNFDILTGASAVLLAILVALERVPRALIWAWNLMGLVLLATIVGLALASMPILQLFGPDRLNTWVTYAPFIWLPGFLVQCAFLGHILVWRRLRATAIDRRKCAPVASLMTSQGGDR